MIDAYWSLPAEQALKEMQSTASGLEPAEAQTRLGRFGPNTVGGHERLSAIRQLARQFRNPLALILIFGAGISLLLKDWLDATIILIIVGGSGLLGFSQEYRASRAVDLLRGRLALRVNVLRGGTAQTVPASEIVPGDVVQLSAGNLVPADGLVLAAQDCLVTQAVLTGESLPVEKSPGTIAAAASMEQRTNTLFMQSSLRSGTATMLVMQTGLQTEYGAIARHIGASDEETEFTRGVRAFGIMLLRVMIVIVLAVLTINQLQGRPVVDSLLFAVALAVGLSPEMLPAIISVTLAVGARHLARDGVIVRRLDAIENLGSMDILCTDKTGTLTEGVVQLDRAIDLAGETSGQVRHAAFLNASFETGIANPLDEAIVAAGKAAGLTVGDHCKLDEIPYDFARRRLSILVEEPAAPGHARMITKGAFADIMAVCGAVRTEQGDRPLTQDIRQTIDALFQEMGESGFRVLAVAERIFPDRTAIDREDETGLTFLGLLLFLDPAKPQIAQSLRDLAALGITTKIISGDNRFVTAHVARQVGLKSRSMLTGDRLARMSDEALRHRAERNSIFAEIDPQQKERIIRALQQSGHAVGYLGDGINDAPALRLADVGISVDKAVDVARESADIVLLHRDIDVIRQGVVDGRRTFANTLKYISITTSANFGNMVSMALAVPLLPFLPLLPKQILLNNFLSDIPSITISTDNVDPEQLEKPQRWHIRDVQRFMIVFGLTSSVFDLLTFGALRWIFHTDEASFHTIWFVISLLTELVVVLVLRTRRFSLHSRPGRLLLGTTAVMTCVCLILPFAPVFDGLFGFERPSWQLLAFSVGLVTCYALATEAMKRFYYARRT
ncbi:magnesium-translocating P-type ATPase [Alteraurantiacibacter aestuarii]|uniref:magnesium-translocating P-type ATPase n=1 Tax=Alteraurantiacibacter aestuarii TaxID=650004 RepID=UPI0031D4E8A9